MENNRNSEETILNEMDVQKTVKREQVETLESTSKTWKKVVISGVSGIMLGAIGAQAADYAFSQVPAEEEIKEEENAETTEDVESAATESSSTEPTAAEPVATTSHAAVSVAVVDDSMSFGEAFAAARQQVGAGGVFEWHGNVYGTYYETEWDAMSDAEKQEWQYQAMHTPMEANEPQAAAVQEEEEPMLLATSEEEQSDDEVKFLGMGEVEYEDGTVMTIAGLESGGQNAVLFDVDNDGTFDIAAIDENRNGEMEENEYYRIDDPTMTTENYQAAMDAQMGVASDSYLADMPDYVNDADGLYDA